MLANARGLTLLEVVIAMGLVGILSTAVIGWQVYFQQGLFQQQQQQQAEHALHHWLHWLWRDLQNTLSSTPSEWHYAANHQCLLYGNVGVRIKSNSLQWRPQSALCHSNGWQALSNPEQVKFSNLSVHNKQLCLAAYVATNIKRQACLPWPL